MFNYEKELPSKYVYLPKMGDEATFHIKTIRRVETGKERFHFIQRETVKLPDGSEVIAEKNLGWHIECELADSEQLLSVNSLAAFFSVFKANDIQDGDRVLIKHVEKGKWEVKKL